MADPKHKRTVNPNEGDQQRNRDAGRPDRNEPVDPEGPGGRNEAKGEADALNKSSRRGER
jgi:hypothetical protein